MKTADLLIISIALTVFATAMLTNSMIDSCVRVLVTSELSNYGQLRAAFDAGTIKAYLGMTTLVLGAMSMVYWGMRKLSASSGEAWNVAALACFFVIAFFSVPSGIAHWQIAGFDTIQFAPSRFIAFQREIEAVFGVDRNGEGGWWMIAAVKTAMAIAIPAIYMSTFHRPLKPIKATKVA
jgi:hypothetical protein